MTPFIVDQMLINLKKKQFVWLRIFDRIPNLDISCPPRWIGSQVQCSLQGSLRCLVNKNLLIEALKFESLFS